MPNKFKAILIDNQNNQFTREVKDLNSDHLKDGNVLVRIDFSSLNFKDAFKEAEKRGEVIDFGEDEKAAIQFADEGNWKEEAFKDRPASAGDYTLPEIIDQNLAPDNKLLNWWSEMSWNNGLSQDEFEAGIQAFKESNENKLGILINNSEKNS